LAAVNPLFRPTYCQIGWIVSRFVRMALPMATEPTPQLDPADRTARIIRALLGMTGQQDKDLAAYLGWSAPTMSKALRGKRHWKQRELEAVAKFFDDIPVGVLFMDPDEMIEMVASRSRCLSAVPDLDDDPQTHEQGEPRRRGHLQLV
jgi:transcriptional regulator with XRE-family HTH domain